MRKFLKRIALAFACVFALAGCAQSYKADNLKSGLEKASYTVDTYTPAEFEGSQLFTVTVKTTEMNGLQKVLLATKKLSDRQDGILILVFDTTENANKVGNPEGSTATDTMSILLDFGKKMAPEEDLSTYGTANNLVWTGSQAAKTAAGIK